jgi:hypothetical protein
VQRPHHLEDTVNPYARIESGWVSIDTTAWLARRTAGIDHDLTADLHHWADQNRISEEQLTATGLCWWQNAVLRWLPVLADTDARPDDAHGTTARSGTAPVDSGPDKADLDEGQVADPAQAPGAITVIDHRNTRLDAGVWIARTSIPRWGALAVVQLNDERPQVYLDVALDPSDWYDADSVDIACRGGHRWTWRTGRELIDKQGRYTTVSVVFGPDLDAPFITCPLCTGYAEGTRRLPCGCDGASWIVCPRCRARCDVTAPTR